MDKLQLRDKLAGADVQVQMLDDDWVMTSARFEAMTKPGHVTQEAARLIQDSGVLGVSVGSVTEQFEEPEGIGQTIYTPFESIYISAKRRQR